MKSILISFLVLFITLFSPAQEYNPIVDALISETNLDSLIKYTRELTGEDSVRVNGSMVLIQNRIYNQNDLAAEYIKQKLAEFGLNPIEQQYSSTGKNIYAIQEGSVHPDEQFIICAHYDAVANYCADDNASGCVAVLETARLLANIDFAYTIIYAFWDEEEIGMVGSSFYATGASQNNDLIKGVVNLEMFGWDSNNDMKFDIHTRNYANSVELANLLVATDETYDLLLDPVVYNPGTTASDHSSFWNKGYSAIVFSEAFFGGDGNPYYHTSQDRIEHFNQPYFHELSKLALGSIATLGEVNESSIQLGLKLFLEGAFLNGEMTNGLKDLDMIPLSQPYFGLPWNYSGIETVMSIPANVVDWVLVDLRESAGDASTATPDKSIAKRAAFILKDGSIKDLDGINNLEFQVSLNDNLYIVIYHRNHLSVISSNPVVMLSGIGNYDFSSGEFQVLGGNLGHKEISPEVWGMIAGDGNSDGYVNDIDKLIFWNANAGKWGYISSDFSMDSQIDNKDKNDLWYENRDYNSFVPQ